MSSQKTSIPVNRFSDELNAGVFIERIAFKDLPDFGEWGQSERHDRHSFFFLEKGSVTMEIDFKKHKIRPSTVIYLHPSQVHRIIAFKGVTVSCMGIDNEHLHSEYLQLLEEITPTVPLPLGKDAHSIVSGAVALCLKYAKQPQKKLYHSFLRDSCNALIALVIAQYLEQARSKDKSSRPEVVTKTFRELLEHSFITMKSPTAYARRLNISTPYLNECVKSTTGFSVSHHIRQRVVLEAKRLLYHSDKSVKEIARELGYDDCPYFSRLFSKATGMTALTFRNKNRE